MPTLFDKIWQAHRIADLPSGTLIYIDRHLVHEVTSPQAFEGLRLSGRAVRRPDATLAVPDHNVPTKDRANNPDPLSVLQLKTLEKNVAEFGVPYIPMTDKRQGIVHVIGPELGFTLPGTTLVCGDSHTSTHGAFGSLAFGIGTSQVEHVLATQTLVMQKPKSMRITVSGVMDAACTAKDMALHIIGTIGTAGGTGHVIEYAGDAVTALSMEGRMTLCNMTIEAGARAGLIAPDDTTLSYMKGRPMAPEGALWDKAATNWLSLATDADGHFDSEIKIDAADISPSVTWGTNPEQMVAVTELVPEPVDLGGDKADAAEKALEYMDLTPGTAMTDISINRVFIGSCTNSRIEDLRDVARIVEGRQVHASLKEALIVPGSGLVKAMAEEEGLDRVFKDAGFEWREPGCSMCLGMNPDKADRGDRVASTSNRNFEGRQGPGARTHLMSPAMAAAAAITGRITDVRTVRGED